MHIVYFSPTMWLTATRAAAQVRTQTHRAFYYHLAWKCVFVWSNCVQTTLHGIRYSITLRLCLVLPPATILCIFSATGVIWELLSSAWAKYKHNISLSVIPTSGGNQKYGARIETLGVFFSSQAALELLNNFASSLTHCSFYQPTDNPLGTFPLKNQSGSI